MRLRTHLNARQYCQFQRETGGGRGEQSSVLDQTIEINRLYFFNSTHSAVVG